MKKTSKMKFLGAIIASFLIVTGCGEGNENGDEAQSVEADDMFVTIAAGGTSGVYYPIAGAMSNIYEAEGIDTSVQATGASVENINLLQSDQAELAIVMADAVEQAYESFGSFEDEDPQKNLVGISGLYPNVVQIITTADSGIETFSDLEGMNVAVGDANSGVELNARMMFEAHSMSYDDISEDYLSYGEAIDQIRNGIIDAAFVTSGVPNGAAMDLASTHDVTVVELEDEGLDYLNENYPFFLEDEVPAGTYDNEKDIQTASITNLLIPNPDLPDEEVYELTRLFYENLEAIQASHDAAQDIDIETVEEGLNVPMHPGAEQYFEEQGVLSGE
ncbi:TRAP transporter TAXI family solute receptor [Virgibacillus natechei]|uniref:TRAP transporter TAXI family solute receptor n=1 Tax=Virgibacillus natechei TaxID=1216297 RepID=A0ABS4IK39_9BACI|nr:TAXI family TRAP transporter solute-binding subunit [Virgibacillus natechei]MBP1971328.1 TRAP transporter TAXI family solute receptor [Virgibacillus natechei]UZD12937.1 TAXI family TRAP transporter solute-binding subunit [Virgibacillus natechei]